LRKSDITEHYSLSNAAIDEWPKRLLESFIFRVDKPFSLVQWCLLVTNFSSAVTVLKMLPVLTFP